MVSNGLLMASCGETARFMSAHADGELRRLRRFRVGRHLAGCERCRAVYRALLATIQGLRALGRSEPPADPGLVEAVLRRVQEAGRDGEEP